MVNIFPFKGYRYNKSKVKIQDVIAPPYDVINPDMKKALAENPYNFIHIHLNDSHGEASRNLKKWIDNGILVKEKQDSLYVYEQEFNHDGKIIKRTGFTCLLKLEPFGKNVLAHEQTFPPIVDERFRLMETTKANLGNLFMMYQDTEKEIDNILDQIKQDPIELGYIDNNQCTHRLWIINNQETINQITKLIKNKKAVMADGHHRYVTALKYRKEHPEIKGNDKILVTLVNSFNEGLLILPTNRIIKNIQFNIDDFEKYFNINELSSLDNLAFPNKAFIISHNKIHYLTEIKDKKILNNIFSEEDKDYIDLDASILQKLIFEKILNIKPEKLHDHIKFVKGNEATIKELKQDEIGFFVNPPSLEQTFELTLKGKIMPQKSTFFYPKLFSGLVINKFEEE